MEALASAPSSVKITSIIGLLYVILYYGHYLLLENKKKNEEKLLLLSKVYVPWSKPKPVVISLTTSPSRIRHIKQILDAIDKRTYDFICVNIPDVYKPTGETYTIPEWMHTYPKLVIHRFGEDLGPISKLVPAVERFPDAFIVTIDDDTLYRRYFVQVMGFMYDQMINQYGMGTAVFATHGLKMNDYWIFNNVRNKKFGMYCVQMLRSWKEYPHQVGEMFRTKLLDFLTVDLVEGFCGIMYPPGSIDPKELRMFSKVSPKTFTSDDMTISMYLSYRGVQKFATKKKNKKFSHIQALPYGFGSDALHSRQNHCESYYLALKHLCCLSPVPFLKKTYPDNVLIAANDISLILKQEQLPDGNFAGMVFPFLESVNEYNDFENDPSMLKNLIMYNKGYASAAPAASDPRQKTLCITCTQFQMLHLLQYLVDLKRNFVLITTNCDYSAPNDVLGEKGMDLKHRLLMNPYLKMWFTNNADEIHPKIRAIPLGIDWHTPQMQQSRRDIAYLHELYFDFKNREYKKVPLLERRKRKVAITFSNSMLDNDTKILPMSSSKLSMREKRRFCYDNLVHALRSTDKIENIPFTKNRMEFWNKMKEYCFIASPHGVGEDCHRTYEALALGCIVLVQCRKESGLRPMFEEMRESGIRICIVDSWKHVTPELLDFEYMYWNDHEKLGESATKMLELPYWLDEIRSTLKS